MPTVPETQVDTPQMAFGPKPSTSLFLIAAATMHQQGMFDQAFGDVKSVVDRMESEGQSQGDLGKDHLLKKSREKVVPNE